RVWCGRTHAEQGVARPALLAHEWGTLRYPGGWHLAIARVVPILLGTLRPELLRELRGQLWPAGIDCRAEDAMIGREVGIRLGHARLEGLKRMLLPQRIPELGLLQLRLQFKLRLSPFERIAAKLQVFICLVDAGLGVLPLLVHLV